MLSITRKSEESFVLETSDGTIEVHISAINGNQVRIGIDAPKEVVILRSELVKKSVAA